MFKAYYFIPLTGFLTSWFLSHILKRFAHRYGFFDTASWRKFHSGTIPRIAGPAIAVGVFLPIFFLQTFLQPAYLGLDAFYMMPFLWGGILALSLGFYDDLKGISSKVKLISQFLIGLWIAWLGLKINVVWLPGFGAISLGILAIPITAFWITLCMNAVNLVDGLDGLCSSLVLISMLALFFISLTNSSMLGIWITLAACGSLAGFLIHNFHPASIFMGDGGSYFLGFLLAALSISSVNFSFQEFQFSSSIFLIGLPLVDTVLAIFRRLMKKQSIFAADGDHIHHCFLHKGLSVRKAVALLSVLQIIFCAIAIVFYFGDFWQVSIAWVLAIALVVYLFIEVVWRYRTTMLFGKIS